MKLTINIDGGSRGNPGPAAYGCYIVGAGTSPLKLKGRLGNTTNNVAEYHGLIRALEKSVELGASEVQILADSELLVRQMTGVYKVKNANIIPLHQIASKLAGQLGKVNYRHVYREQNSMADALCNEALDDPSLPIEALGQRHDAPSSVNKRETNDKVPTRKASKPGSSAKEYVKVKLVGSLLSLMSIKRVQEYAVVVKGTSWKLALAKIPGDVKPGDYIEVVGELVILKNQPVVKVKRMQPA
jgi:ribonuclease HI